jgi:hypothetical protein
MQDMDKVGRRRLNTSRGRREGDLILDYFARPPPPRIGKLLKLYISAAEEYIL